MDELDFCGNDSDSENCDTQNKVFSNKNTFPERAGYNTKIQEENIGSNNEETLRKAEEERHKRNIEDLTVAVTIFEQNMKRQSYYKNQVTNSCIFLEKLLMTTDVIKAMILTQYKNLPEDLNNRINVLVESMNKNIETLIDIVQKPSNTRL